MPVKKTEGKKPARKPRRKKVEVGSKGLTALANCRLEGESHGKVVDFLACVFGALSDRDKGMIRRASTGRNALSYDNPANPDIAFCQAALDLASRLLAAARAGSLPERAKKIPPPPERG